MRPRRAALIEVEDQRVRPLDVVDPRPRQRRALGLEAVEPLAEPLERGLREARADASRVAQRAPLAHAEDQRAEAAARAAGIREARDDELLLLGAFDLEPIRRAPAPVRGVLELADDALEREVAGMSK